MSLDVVYQGLPIAKAAPVRFEDGALFIETDGPMPVATALDLSHGAYSLRGRVKRVREGVGAGMFVTSADASKLPRWLIALHPATSHAAEFEPEPVIAPPPPPVSDPQPAVVASEPQPAIVASEPQPAIVASEPQPAIVASEPQPVGAELPVEATPSNSTPDSDGEAASAGSSDEDEEAKSAKPGAKPAAAANKAKKKPRRR